MRLLIHTLAWLAAWPGVLLGSILWCQASVKPAGITLAVSAAGFLVLWFFKFSDRWDEVHSRARARQVHAVVQQGPYEREAS